MTTEKYITYKTIAKLLDVGESTIRRRVDDGTFPKPYKFGKLVRFKESEITAAIAKMTIKAKT